MSEDFVGGSAEFLSALFKNDEEAKSIVYDDQLARYNLSQSYIECFSTPAGQEVLQDLWARYVETIQFDPRVENPEVMGFFNEGAKSVILEINHRLKKVGEKPPQLPEDEIVLG